VVRQAALFGTRNRDGWDTGLTILTALGQLLLNRGTELRRFEAHASPVTSVAVFADGRRALSGSEDGIVRLWDLATGAQLDQVEGLTGGVGSLTVLPDGRRVLCGLSDGTLCLWEMGTAGNSRFGAP